MPEDDNLRDGEWVTQRLIEAYAAREAHQRKKAAGKDNANRIHTVSADHYLRMKEIEARNAKLRVEILQYAFRNSLRHGNHI